MACHQGMTTIARIRQSFVWLGLTTLLVCNSSAYDLTINRNDPEQEILIDFHLEQSDIIIREDPDSGFLECAIEGCTDMRPAGFLRLPIISRLLQISNTKIPKITIEDCQVAVVPSDPIPLISNGRDFSDRLDLDETTVISASEITPINSSVNLNEPEILRDIRVSQFSFYPVEWSESDRSFHIIQSARIRISMSGEDHRNILMHRKRISDTYDRFYRSVILNYTSDSRNRTGELEKYLIFTPDAFESRLQGFISWKEQEGFNVGVIRQSELPAYPNPADLKALIQSEYASPDPPVFVLLIGDEYATPIFYSYDPTHPGDYADDLYYSMLAGDDFLPDVFLGRLPAENGIELSTMLQKILCYEQNPPMSEPGMYHTGLMSASALEESQIVAKQQTAQRLIEFCDYQNMHEIYDWTTTSVSEVIDLINSGVSIINYRGEGWRRGWNPLHTYWFDDDDVYSLENSNKTPFITSIGCGVNMFNTTEDCFGHAWMAHGTPQTPMGAVGIIGPTWNTHTTYNNWMDRGMYRGYVYWNVCRSAPFMDYGKVYMRDQFPEPEHSEYVEITFRTYVDFGTPDMWIRLGMPSEPHISLAYDNSSNSKYITVRNGFGDLVDNAMVSWSANGNRWAMMTDDSAGVPCGFSSVTGNLIDVVVTGENLIPSHILLPWRVNTTSGSLIITEIKPDVPTTGTQGDKIELYNAGLATVDLRDWTVSDLDGYDGSFVRGSASLAPQQLVVIEFVGPAGVEQITPKPYGLYITSQELPDFSSQEDIAVLRAPNGKIMDSLAWHDLSGFSSSNVAIDLSKVTAPTSTMTVDAAGWWAGPDTVTQSDYESNTIDWSPFSGNDGTGSIQRSSIGSPDGPGNFTIQISTGFGSYYHLSSKLCDSQQNQELSVNVRE